MGKLLIELLVYVMKKKEETDNIYKEMRLLFNSNAFFMFIYNINLTF